jgi:hypothetical protein
MQINEFNKYEMHNSTNVWVGSIFDLIFCISNFLINICFFEKHNYYNFNGKFKLRQKNTV